MDDRSYDRISIWLHWLVAAMVITQFATAWVWGVFERGSEPRMYLFRIHLVVGSGILFLAVVRIGWRLTHRAPPLPADMNRPTVVASKITHLLLYAAIVVQPTLGLLAVTAFGKTLGRWPRDVHNGLSNLIAAIIFLHVAAAIWHHFIRRDGLILRMLPARSPAQRQS